MASWLTSDVRQTRNWFFQQRLSTQFAAQVEQQHIGRETKAWLDTLLVDTAQALKHDRTTTVKRVTLGEREVIVKRYNARNQWHRVKRSLRKTRADRCWHMSYRFQQCGLNVARPLLMHEDRWGPLRKNAYFVTEFLEGKELLGALPLMTQEEQAAVATEIKNAFNLMRQNKLSHGDMKASNLLWVSGRLVFIDLDAAAVHRTLIGWKRAHRKDLKRFMKNWRDHADLTQLFNSIL